MTTSSFWPGFSCGISLVEGEGRQALKIEVVVSLALCAQFIALTIVLVSLFWALRERYGKRCRDSALPNSTNTSDPDVAAICTTRTGRKYHRPDRACARHAVGLYIACAKCYPELHRRKEEQQVAVSGQVEFAASRGQSLTRGV